MGDGTGLHVTAQFDRERFERMIEIRPKPGACVSREEIMARIDFPDGVHRWLPFAGEILPLPWIIRSEQTKEMWDRRRRT